MTTNKKETSKEKSEESDGTPFVADIEELYEDDNGEYKKFFYTFFFYFLLLYFLEL